MKHSKRYGQDVQANYRVKVQGLLSPRWASWFGSMKVTIEERGDSPVITTLAGELVDQAALMGLLHKLYNLGFVLLEVNRQEID